VTGLGVVTPLGTGVETVWKRVLDGRCGVKAHDFGGYSLGVKIAASVPRGDSEGDFREEDWIPRMQRGHCSPFIAYSLAAAKQALDDAGWHPETEEGEERTGVSIGSGTGCTYIIEDSVRRMDSMGVRRSVSPYTVPKHLPNMASGNVSIRYGFKGPNMCSATACAAGAHSIADAYSAILLDRADVMVAGGAESCLSPTWVQAFYQCRSLTVKFNESPQEASRPFDIDRSGFVIGEGAGVLVLEEMVHAKRRGATIYAEVNGFGMSSDASHIVQPDREGSGAARSMRAAFRSSGVPPSDIRYVNAHATSTPLGDIVEGKAVRSVFGELTKEVFMTSTKGATGHMLGASGAVQAVFAILGLRDQVIPPTLNLHSPDPEIPKEITLIAREAYEVPKANPLKSTLCNAFGFGGTNATLIFSRMF